MILDGKRAKGAIPVCEKGDRIPFSIALTGNTIKTVHTFTEYGYLHEILVKVPTLANAVSVVLTLHDIDYQTAADARYTSAALGETATHTIRGETVLTAVFECVPFKRFVCPGDTLRVAANAGADTDTLAGVLYVAGI